MIKMNLGSAKIRDPKTKQFNPIAGLIGESAYQTAIRLGTFSGTEKEWNDYIKTEREKALEDILVKPSVFVGKLISSCFPHP